MPDQPFPKLKLGTRHFRTPAALQYPFSGTATDEPLMQWLDKYTFPTEARFQVRQQGQQRLLWVYALHPSALCHMEATGNDAVCEGLATRPGSGTGWHQAADSLGPHPQQDLAFAREAFRSVVNRTLAHGTTTAAYYGTLHEAPCRVLADVVEELGQRALVGKVWAGAPRVEGVGTMRRRTQADAAALAASHCSRSAPQACSCTAEAVWPLQWYALMPWHPLHALLPASTPDSLPVPSLPVLRSPWTETHQPPTARPPKKGWSPASLLFGMSWPSSSPGWRR